jgi:transposase-like protein
MGGIKINFFDFIKKFPSETDIINLYIDIRYNGKILCSHCGSDRVSRRIHNPKFFQCNNCNNSFSIFKGTIFENTTTDLRKWLYVSTWLFLNNMATINARKIQMEIDVTYKTAWRIVKQIRGSVDDLKNKDFFRAVAGTL